jgi:hypothetical protein
MRKNETWIQACEMECVLYCIVLYWLDSWLWVTYKRVKQSETANLREQDVVKTERVVFLPDIALEFWSQITIEQYGCRKTDKLATHIRAAYVYVNYLGTSFTCVCMSSFRLFVTLCTSTGYIELLCVGSRPEKRMFFLKFCHIYKKKKS